MPVSSRVVGGGSYAPSSGFEKILDILSRPNYLSANIAQFIKGDSPYEHWYEAAGAGLTGKSRVTYSDITGNVASGLALDILLDPITYIPFGGIPKAVKATRIPMMGEKALVAIGKKVPYLGKAGGTVKSVLMRGFVDRLYRIKMLSGVDDSLKELKRLKIGDDIVEMARAGDLTDDILKTVPKEAHAHLKHLEKYYGFIEMTDALPRAEKKLRHTLGQEYHDLLKAYHEFEKVEPEKAKHLLNALEYGLSTPDGMSKKFIESVRGLGVSADEIVRIQNEVNAGVAKDIFGKRISDTMGKILPEQWSTPEYKALMDAALTKLDPRVRTVYDRAIKAHKAITDELIRRKMVTADIIKGFAERTGMAHIHHLLNKGEYKKAVEAVNVAKESTAKKLFTDTVSVFEELEKNLNALGMPRDEVLKRVQSLDKFIRGVADNNIGEIFAKPELIEDASKELELLLKSVNAPKEIFASLGKFKKLAGQYKEFRYIHGTAYGINAMAGRKIFETDLAKIFLDEEIRLGTACIYHDYLLNLIDNAREISKTGKSLIESIPKGAKSVDLPRDFMRFDDEVLGSFMIHKDLLDPFKQFAKYTRGNTDDLNAVLRVTDKITSIWKYTTLIPFGKFHIRNIVSEVSFNGIVGMNPLTDPRVLGDYGWGANIWWAAKKGKAADDYAEAISKGVIKTGFTRTEAAAHTLGRLGELKGIKQYTGMMENIGEYAEEVPRLAMWRWAKRTGKWKKMGFRSPEDMVRKFHVDYGSLTSFESKFLKRIMPFYSWYRFNIPLHVEMLAQKPSFYLNVEKTRRAVSEVRGVGVPEEWMPEYIREGYSVGWGKRPEGRQYVLLRGWYPAPDINSLLSFTNARDQFVQMLHPAKMIPEVIWGYDTFRKRKIPAYPGETVKMFGMLWPARAAYIPNSIRIIKEVNTLLGARQDVNSAWDKLTYSLFGKVYTVDEAKTKRYLKWEMGKQIGDIDKGIERAKEKNDYRTVKRLMRAKAKLEQGVKQL